MSKMVLPTEDLKNSTGFTLSVLTPSDCLAKTGDEKSGGFSFQPRNRRVVTPQSTITTVREKQDSPKSTGPQFPTV